jgi:hypothetical protein
LSEIITVEKQVQAAGTKHLFVEGLGQIDRIYSIEGNVWSVTSDEEFSVSFKKTKFKRK